MGGVSGGVLEAVHSPANGLAACRDCHTWIHLNVTQAELLGWLVPRGFSSATTPAYILTTQGQGWWELRVDGGYNYCRFSDPSAQVRGQIGQ